MDAEDVALVARDRYGAQVAILTWAVAQGFPEINQRGLHIAAGEDSWVAFLRSATAFQLATLWDALGDWADLKISKEVSAMPVGRELQWTEQPVLELQPGWYLAKIEDVNEVESQLYSTTQLALRLSVLDDKGEAIGSITAYCNAKWGPNTTLYRWVSSIFGKKAPPPGLPFDPDTLIGKVVAAKLEQRPGKNGPRLRVVDLGHRSLAEEEG